MTTPVLELSDVTTSLMIDGTLSPVVADVSFSIEAGEIVGLVGESGSGKSMTARTIMRLLPPNAECVGKVLLNGSEVPTAGRALRQLRGREMAMIFQDPRAHIDPLYRNGAHVVEGVRAHRHLHGDDAVAEALRLLRSVGIDDAERVFHAYPDQVSGGMLQRVLIAGALTADPRLLIADEPTTSLDVTTQAEIAALLDQIRRQDRGVLFITHDLDLAAAICDRTIVMYAGRIMEAQPTDSLFGSPLHPYTAKLMCARPRLDRRVKIAVIPGQPISAYEAPAGCPFHPRCSYAARDCTVGVPVLASIGELARSACIRVGEIGERLRDEVASV